MLLQCHVPSGETVARAKILKLGIIPGFFFFSTVYSNIIPGFPLFQTFMPALYIYIYPYPCVPLSVSKVHKSVVTITYSAWTINLENRYAWLYCIYDIKMFVVCCCCCICAEFVVLVVVSNHYYNITFVKSKLDRESPSCAP